MSDLAEQSALPERPNIVIILTDDQGAWALGCAGNGEMRTPNLDRLAQSGARFENYFCTCPVCSPARATILTGCIPSQHGVHDFIRIRQGQNPLLGRGNGRAIEYLRGQTGYTDVLAEQGYTCGMSGKWHLGDECHAQKSFSYWRVSALGNGAYYRTPMVTESDPEPKWDERYFTDVITDGAIGFIDQHGADDAPFYLSCHYTAPHSPWQRRHHPEATFDRYFKDCPFASVPDVPINPTQMQRQWLEPDGSNRRELLSGYFAAVEEMDKGVGRILDSLEAKGLRENTLVFFTSDNGMNMGHHGIFGKGNGTFPLNMFDTSVKVPAMVSCPGSIPEGQVRQELLSHYDIFPTILDCVGADAPETTRPRPGRSFAPLLRGGNLAGPERVVVHNEYGLVRMIRSQQWKYVHRHPFGPHELYDLRSDPDEDRNLVDGPEHADRIVSMKRELDEWFARHADPARDGLHESVAGTGQIDLAGMAAQGRPNFGSPPKVVGQVDP